MRELNQEFQDFVAARGAALLRTAYLLTGDQQLSEDLVQTSLEKALRHWSKIKVAAATEGYVRQIMYRENVSMWRHLRARADRSRQPVVGPPGARHRDRPHPRRRPRPARARLRGRDGLPGAGHDRCHGRRVVPPTVRAAG